jgi:hypothetical protein
MPGESERDWTDDVLRQAPRWEPPAGFALRVVNAARQEPLQETAARQTRRERLYLAGWWRGALVIAVRKRVEGAVWVVGQYWKLLRG